MICQRDRPVEDGSLDYHELELLEIWGELGYSRETGPAATKHIFYLEIGECPGWVAVDQVGRL